ncbi:MAG: DUF91 domain-containing protein [Planctomycetota bacterium]|nr:MAG: DUF91 domain-containing protein [Planctomycetota bacterium]
MPVEVALWRIDEKPIPVSYTTIDDEKTLEERILQDVALIDDGLFLIGRQVRTAYGGFIDLLALDRDGNTVVIELKRNKTPREVVAQLLDYASWVRRLDEDDLREIYEAFARQHLPEADRGKSLDQRLCEHFNLENPPETFNDAHRLIVVAGALDHSTERIIEYLAEECGVNINAVFFRHFKDQGHSYLCRAWLIPPEEVQSRAAISRAKREWNGEYYVSFGHVGKDGRHWDDARKYGFVSAGGGSWYTRTLGLLESGARIWVNVPKTGYVGVGIVEDAQPMLADEFLVTHEGRQVPITHVPLRGRLKYDTDDPDKQERLVRVKWIRTLPLEEAIKEKGLFGNQNTVAKPTTPKWDHTVERLKQAFGITD